MTKLGILGGGQLARMMIPHAHKLGIEITVLDSADCPCAGIAHRLIQGSFRNPDDVAKLSDCDVVTVEIEDVSVEGLKRLQAAGVAVRPSIELIEMIQDKGRQKDFFARHHIPTAPYQIILSAQPEQIPRRGSFVKLCRGGYDGRGVWNPEKVPQMPLHFKQRDVVLEDTISVDCELAQLVVRSLNGQIMLGPLVEMSFDSTLNLIDCTLIPARTTKKIETQAQKIAQKIVHELNYVGVMAVEMFLVGDQLLVNELAPRPHNSGHGTIELCVTDQFEEHLRAVCDKPLTPFELKVSGATFNLLGADGYSGETIYEGTEVLKNIPQAHLHWYGKKDCRPGRKMGHLTVVSPLDQIQQLKQRIRPWPSVRGKNPIQIPQ